MKQIATINLIIIRSTIFSNNMQQNTNEIQNKIYTCIMHAIYIQSSEETFKIDSKKVVVKISL